MTNMGILQAKEGVNRWNLDTIAAISTPMGEGAIAIVRLSGEEAIGIADQIFRAAGRKPCWSAKTHTIHYGHIIDPKTGETAKK